MTKNSGNSTGNSRQAESKTTRTEAPTAELTDVQKKADADRREWEDRMAEEAKEAEKRRDSASHS